MAKGIRKCWRVEEEGGGGGEGGGRGGKGRRNRRTKFENTQTTRDNCAERERESSQHRIEWHQLFMLQSG